MKTADQSEITELANESRLAASSPLDVVPGFWGSSGTNGWSYDTMLVIMNLVVLTTGGGNLSLMKWLGSLQA